MRHDEFYIGRDFYTAAGQWRCTDVGSRVIIAIQLAHDDQSWYQGPPYAVEEVVFDETDLAGCAATPDELHGQEKKAGAPYPGPVAGIDGCQDGWVAAVLRPDFGVAFVRYAAFDELVAAVDGGRITTAIVDIPIGLPEPGPRRVDLAARRLLRGPERRGSSVFRAPPRAVFGIDSHAEASAACRRVTGVGLPIQAQGIVPKVAEVDRLMTPERQLSIREGHPEVTACLLNEGRTVAASKNTGAGIEARLALVRREFARRAWPEPEVGRVPGAAANDVVDAMLLLVSAIRLVEGVAHVLPEEPETDAHGLRAEMVA